MNLKNKNRSLRYTAGLLIVFGVFALALLGKNISYLSLLAVELTKWCKSLMLACLPYVTLVKTLALYSGSFIIVGGIIYGLTKGTLSLIKSYRTIKRLPIIDKGLSVILIKDDNHKLAFTHGLFCPRIYLSTALLDGLTRAELRGVVLHEAHHRRRRDPLRFFTLSLIKDALFYLPISRWFLNEMVTETEFKADDHARKRTASPIELASALVKVTRSMKDSSTRLVSYAHASIDGRGRPEGRIKRLISGNEHRAKMPLSLAIKSLLVAVVLLAATTLPLISSADYNDGCDMTHCSTMHSEGSHNNTGTECVEHCDMKH